ncbi:hypothetical protein BFM98_14015 [Lysinibacillus sp. AR18-8]|uniref:hypothetical protein n=1 Tax=Lysinibacillus sp. AR18-8 TaxID=1889781 RepID=UPI000825418F|nr:hypothetical protein [Lysinibacillus sp. AR18-8]OCX63323.1 hypothetical protein BFM98_14015 [Lysinibacillus sp. AR18-8]
MSHSIFNVEKAINAPVNPSIQEERRNRFKDKYKKTFNSDLNMVTNPISAPKQVVVNVYGIKSKWI